MTRKLLLFFIIATLAIFAAGCGGDGNNAENGNNKDTITIKHELDETKVVKNPQKVVVFDFGILDSLDKLGVEVTGLPQVTIPSYLSKYEDKKYENVGSLKEPDFEKIAGIGPDLIIISARQMEMYDEFAEIAPTVYMPLDTGNYMDSFTENMNTLGKIFDKEKEVEAELASIDERIATLQEKVAETEGNALVILANEGNISAYGPGSRFGVIHDVFGLAPADEKIEVSTHGQNVSPEYISETNPDYLFVVDRGAVVGGQSSAETIVETVLVKNTKAYKDGHIVYLNADYWYLSGGGLISVSEMINQIEEAIQ